ncbi:hypothetical protein pipiens_013656 [Culex pipiens pipiens]|uniref:Uncharacterized protein n=1 Tax=Culex pipiens pipiens TaxID=38569 RepID=A0ABD1CXM9_CULPP
MQLKDVYVPPYILECLMKQNYKPKSAEFAMPAGIMFAEFDLSKAIIVIVAALAVSARSEFDGYHYTTPACPLTGPTTITQTPANPPPTEYLPQAEDYQLRYNDIYPFGG